MLAISLTAVVVVTAFVAPRLLAPATRPLQSNEQKLVGRWRFFCPDHIHFREDRTWKHTTIHDWELTSGHWSLTDSDRRLMQADQVTIGGVSLDQQSTHSLHDGQVEFIDQTVADIKTGSFRWRLSRTEPGTDAASR